MLACGIGCCINKLQQDIEAQTAGKSKGSKGSKAEEQGGEAKEAGSSAEEAGSSAEEEGSSAGEEGGKAEEAGSSAGEEGGKAEEEGGKAEEEGSKAKNAGKRSKAKAAKGSKAEAKGSKAEEKGSEKRKPFPWQGAHAVTGHRLHLTHRTDRNALIILAEEGRQVCSCIVEKCGAPSVSLLGGGSCSALAWLAVGIALQLITYT